MNKPSRQVQERWSKEEMTDAIVQYLTEHPQASDTLDGIAEWWIMRQKIQVEYNTLKEVLRQLAESGLLEEIGEGDNRRYSLRVKEDELLN